MAETQGANMEQAGNQSLRLIACPHLALEHGKIDRYVPEGETVAGHLRALGWHPEGLHARVFIDGQMIERAQWEFAVPKAGQVFVSRVIPMGGDDEGGKTALRIVAMIAVIVAASYVGGFFPFPLNVAVTTAISVAASMALNALIPAPLPRRPLRLPQPGLKEVA